MHTSLGYRSGVRGLIVNLGKLRYMYTVPTNVYAMFLGFTVKWYIGYQFNTTQ